ncbi:MAG: ATP-binding protein, partial [Deltaproteobacteria bacterium]
EPVELQALTQQIVDDALLEAGQRGAHVHASLQAGLTVRGSRELLQRAIENVVRNAVRFTDTGTVVEVALERQPNRAVLTVRDHGPGVPADALERIFKPFYRVAGDRARTTGGTGLGLAITERAVSLQGGKVQAQNHPSRGLVVTIELPLEGGAAAGG